jgi:hypothetical protein
MSPATTGPAIASTPARRRLRAIGEFEVTYTDLYIA